MNKNHYLKTTINVWGEGDRDVSFLRYLYSLYHVHGRELKINNAHGGDPECQIRQMIKYYNTTAFDEKYALYDLDRGIESVTKARELAAPQGIVCVESDRCLETELIRIMTTDAKLLKQAKKSSNDAKNALAKLCHLKNVDSEVDWKKWAPKGMLDMKCKESRWLKKILKIIRG